MKLPERQKLQNCLLAFYFFAQAFLDDDLNDKDHRRSDDG
jgi:hypothetical protein